LFKVSRETTTSSWNSIDYVQRSVMPPPPRVGGYIDVAIGPENFRKKYSRNEE